MPQLDRFLNILSTNNGTALLLSEGDIASVMIKDNARPVMKQPLTSAQILNLIREIAPANAPHSLDAQGSVRFEYTSGDGTFDVSMTQNGKIAAKVERRSAGATPQASAPTVESARPSASPVAPARGSRRFAAAHANRLCDARSWCCCGAIPG